MSIQTLDAFGVDGFPTTPPEYSLPDNWFGVDGWADSTHLNIRRRPIHHRTGSRSTSRDAISEHFVDS